MPWTLYRYILADLLKVIGLTTGILVTVIAFGAAVKPLANDRLLDAAQTAKYIGLIIVPMLQYALPFAAGFGATLSFHRLTADNEIQAMAASGVSYHRIMMPVIALGLALTLLLIVLTQTVIPQFWTMIVRTVAQDITRLFQASINRGEAFQIGNMQVYADTLSVEEWPEGPDGPATRMVLLNVAAADLDDNGRIVTDVTAGDAVVDIYRRDGQMYLKMVMHDTVASNPETGQLVYSERFAPQRAIAVPIDVSESIKALTITQMLEYRHEPGQYGPVARAKEALAQSLRDSAVRQSLADRLAADGRLEFHDLSSAAPGERTYIVHAERLSPGGRFAGARGKPVEITVNQNGVATMRLSADSVQLASPAAGAIDVPTFDLVIGEHEVTNLLHSGGAANRRMRLVLPSLGTADRFDETNVFAGSSQLIEEAGRRTSNRQQLDARAARLEHEILRMHHEITARMANRFALSITAMLLLALGALMAMWHRGGLPLTIYAWAFIPAILDLILISAGEQLLRDGRLWAHGVMWSGNVILLAMCVLTAARVARN